MSSCLVQKLFRLKIGKELDSGVVDDVLFPLLLKHNYLPYSLHLDILMVQNITIYPRSTGNLAPANMPQMILEKVPPFAKACSGPTHLGMLRSCGQEDRLTNGRHGSKFRRKKTHKRNWGSVPDISGYWRIEKEKSLRLRSKFVNGFLDYLIKKGDHPSWGGNPRCEFQPVLTVGEWAM
jgi:hypothetical protein